MMLGDVTVRHAQAGGADVEQDVDRLVGSHQDRVLPDEIRLDHRVAAEDQKATGLVDMERMVHPVVTGDLVEHPDLHPVADPEAPVERRVLRAGLAVDQLPARVGRGRDLVDLDHVVFALEPVGRRVVVAVRKLVPLVLEVGNGVVDEPRRQQLHFAVWAVTGFVAHDFRVHRAGVGAGSVPVGRVHVRVGDEGRCLVRLGIQVRVINSCSATMSALARSRSKCSSSDGSTRSGSTWIVASRYTRCRIRCSSVSFPGWWKSASTTARSDGARMTSSTNCSCST